MSRSAASKKGPATTLARNQSQTEGREEKSARDLFAPTLSLSLSLAHALWPPLIFWSFASARAKRERRFRVQTRRFQRERPLGPFDNVDVGGDGGSILLAAIAELQPFAAVFLSEDGAVVGGAQSVPGTRLKNLRPSLSSSSFLLSDARPNEGDSELG